MSDKPDYGTDNLYEIDGYDRTSGGRVVAYYATFPLVMQDFEDVFTANMSAFCVFKYDRAGDGWAPIPTLILRYDEDGFST